MTRIADGPTPMPTKVDERRDAAKARASTPSEGSAPAQGANLLAEQMYGEQAVAERRAKAAAPWMQ